MSAPSPVPAQPHEPSSDIYDVSDREQSNDASIISASHFKRRPRGASFLTRDRPSSRTGPNTPGVTSTFNIGVFRRRAREPSILGTAQKPRPQQPEPEYESEEEEFAPEAESTPFKRTKRQSGEAESGQEVPKASDPNPRKRKSDEGHQQLARSPPFGQNAHIVESVEQSDSDALSQQPSLPPLPQEQSRPVTPAMDNELLAPPLSSGSSDDEQEIWPPLQSLAKGRTRRPASGLRRTPPVQHDHISDVSSPPSLTYSPNYPVQSPPPKQPAKIRRRAASKPEPKVTTADLTEMLPRRRRRHGNVRGDPFALGDESDAEVDISGLGNDDDELSHLDVRARKRPTRPVSRAVGGKNRSETRGRPAQRRQDKQTSASGKSASRTYGRPSSDKENRPENDTGEDDSGREDNSEGDSDEIVARVGSELKNAARKFQEVDKWTLEFEEMTQSSDLPDAR